MTPAEFLIALWGDTPPGQILVWMLPNKRSTWLTGVPITRDGQKVLHDFLKTHDGCDIYTGVSLAPRHPKLSPHERVTSANSAGIAGMWADIDIADTVHKKQNLPPSIEAAQEVLLAEYPPSITVNSGHGLQCWWLFRESWIFKDAGERALAQRRARVWHSLLSKSFQAQGWTLDATHDLARVMRLPGTFNHKSGDARPVEVIGVSDFRWSLDLPAPEEIQSELLTSEARTPAATEIVIGALLLDPEAEPPVDKLETLLEAIPEFARSWNRKRTDFQDGDQSPSVYDQSLAYWAVMGRWSDDEIAALIISHRRRWGYDLKLRQDYYQRTIAKARGNQF